MVSPVGASAAFTVNNSFNFNSDYCDIDLYRVRVFQTGLAMPDVIHNYLSDLHSIALYDQNQLTDAQRPTQLSYELLTQYNKDNKDNPTMPYCVWKVTSVADEKLPYFTSILLLIAHQKLELLMNGIIILIVLVLKLLELISMFKEHLLKDIQDVTLKQNIKKQKHGHLQKVLQPVSQYLINILLLIAMALNIA